MVFTIKVQCNDFFFKKFIEKDFYYKNALDIIFLLKKCFRNDFFTIKLH